MNLGRKGEDMAEQYLKKQGWRVLLRNYARKYGEIDIIARDPDGVLVFVEVKTMRPGSFIPEDNLTFSKISKVSKIAEMFANKHPELIGEKGWRVDGLTILTNLNNYCDIKLYPNILDG